MYNISLSLGGFKIGEKNENTLTPWEAIQHFTTRTRYTNISQPAIQKTKTQTMSILRLQHLVYHPKKDCHNYPSPVKFTYLDRCRINLTNTIVLNFTTQPELSRAVNVTYPVR